MWKSSSKQTLYMDKEVEDDVKVGGLHFPPTVLTYDKRFHGMGRKSTQDASFPPKSDIKVPASPASLFSGSFADAGGPFLRDSQASEFRSGPSANEAEVSVTDLDSQRKPAISYFRKKTRSSSLCPQDDDDNDDDDENQKKRPTITTSATPAKRDTMKIPKTKAKRNVIDSHDETHYMADGDVEDDEHHDDKVASSSSEESKGFTWIPPSTLYGAGAPSRRLSSRSLGNPSARSYSSSTTKKSRSSQTKKWNKRLHRKTHKTAPHARLKSADNSAEDCADEEKKSADIPPPPPPSLLLGCSPQRQYTLKRHYDEDDLTALVPPEPPTGPVSSKDLLMKDDSIAPPRDASKDAVPLYPVIADINSVIGLKPAPMKKPPCPSYPKLPNGSHEDTNAPTKTETSPYAAAIEALRNGGVEDLQEAIGHDIPSELSNRQQWEDVIMHVGIIGNEPPTCGATEVAVIERAKDEPLATGILEGSVTSEDAKVILARQETVSIQPASKDDAGVHRDEEDDDEVSELIPENGMPYLTLQPSYSRSHDSFVTQDPRFIYDEYYDRHYAEYGDDDSFYTSGSEEESSDDEGMNAIAIGYPVLMDEESMEDIVEEASQEREVERSGATEDDFDEEPPRSIHLRSVEEITQEAVSRVIALNIAQHEHETRRQRKKADNIDDDEAGENEEAFMLAVVRRRTNQMSLRSSSKTLEGSGYFGESGEVSIGGAASPVHNRDVEALAEAITMETESSCIDPIAGSEHSTRNPINEDDAIDGDDTNGDLEAQVGIPVVPGAVAMVGIDSHPGQQLSGYDSGFDDNSDVESHTSRLAENREGFEGFNDEGNPIEGVVVGQSDANGLLIDAEPIDNRDKPFILQFIRSKFFLALLAVSIIVIAIALAATSLSGDKREESSGDDDDSPRFWRQVGEEIFPDDRHDEVLFGSSVSMSRDGTRLAVGLPGFNANRSSHDVGGVDIFDLVDEQWVRRAKIQFPGQPPRSLFGEALALSRDGKRVVVAAPFLQDDMGSLTVFETNRGPEPFESLSNATQSAKAFETVTSSWRQIGVNILIPSMGESVMSVAISELGDRIVGGASQSMSVNGTVVGSVRAFRLINSTWEQAGATIWGSEGFQFGSAVAMSASGTRIAVGSPSFDGSGEVHVYDYVEALDAWQQSGRSIRAMRALFGFSLSFSEDGKTLAIGAPRSAGVNNVGTAGGVEVYRFDSSTQDWKMLGAPVLGSVVRGFLGTSLSLSSNGTTVAIGGPQFPGEGGGEVRVFALRSDNHWAEYGTGLRSDTDTEQFGTSVAISGNGARFAGGAPFENFDGRERRVGRVLVYDRV